MATKAQIINFIIATFCEMNGEEITKSKLDGYKKSELEEFIKEKGLEAELTEWVKIQ